MTIGNYRMDDDLQRVIHLLEAAHFNQFERVYLMI